MKYCKSCLYPDTKPDLTFNNKQICSACVSFENRKLIDWKDRENQFKNICRTQQLKNNTYDCIVPVSGGKDSHYQVIKCLEYGLRPLAVNARTCDLSSLGRINLNNIAKLGVDVIEIDTGKKIRAKLNKLALQEIGDCSWPEHVTIFTVPFIIADVLDIDLIVWGENPQNEYGGPYEKSINSHELNGEQWLNEFGGLNGLRVSDIVDRGIRSQKELTWYNYPPCVENIKSIFLGYYFPWDGYENYKLAAQHGFIVSSGPVEGIGYVYENLDNYQTGLRDYIKYLKFGFGRATDLVCNNIRRGRLTREEGIEHIEKYDGQYPSTYLGKPLHHILDNINLNVQQFNQICEAFTNNKLFDDISFWGTSTPKFKVGKDS